MKYVLAHQPLSLFILSGGLETALSTGQSSIGIGAGVWKFSPYLAAGEGFGGFHEQSSVKYEAPNAAALPWPGAARAYCLLARQPDSR